MNVPSAIGRLDATIPLVELVLDREELRLRPRWFAAWFHTEFRVQLVQITSAFRVRGRVMTSGVGFTMTDGQTGYFWTWSHTDEVLAALRARGVTIDPQPRTAGAIWRALPTSTMVATTPVPHRAFAWLLPVGAVAATVIMIVLVTDPDLPLWFRWFMAGAWASGLLSSFFVWRAARSRP
jgi:hypothetical protein